MNNLVPYSDMRAMAKDIATSGLFGMKNEVQVLALMAVAQAEGKHPAIIARDYDIIQGRPAKKSEAMLRDFLAGGGKVEWHAMTDEKADATFSHPAGGTLRVDWDMKRAQQAELKSKDMYRKYPRQMLRARVISEGVRAVGPFATSGLYVPEEVHEFEPRAPIEGTATVVETKAAYPEPVELPPLKGKAAAQVANALTEIRAALALDMPEEEKAKRVREWHEKANADHEFYQYCWNGLEASERRAIKQYEELGRPANGKAPKYPVEMPA